MERVRHTQDDLMTLLMKKDILTELESKFYMAETVIFLPKYE